MIFLCLYFSPLWNSAWSVSVGIHWDNICENNHEIARCLMTTQEGPVAQFLLPCLDRLKPRTVNRAWRSVENFSEVSQPADRKQHVTKAFWFRTPRPWALPGDLVRLLPGKEITPKESWLFPVPVFFQKRRSVYGQCLIQERQESCLLIPWVHFFNTVFVKMGGH